MTDDTLHDDFVALLNTLELGDHARPTSMHRIMQDEVLPAIEKLKGNGALPGALPGGRFHVGVAWGIRHPGPSQLKCPYCISTLQQGDGS